jgi:CheY-like chemotaxis protein
VAARVLVVDDHEDTVLLFVEELREAGFEVVGTTSANEAVSIALSIGPDVIITDIGMPDINGHELARRVRAADATRCVRLVAVSAQARTQATDDTPAAWWDAYLAKPVEPGALTHTVNLVMAASVPPHRDRLRH